MATTTRRTFLTALGIMAAAPSLLVAKGAVIDRFGEEAIPTGFPELDLANNGGLKRGELHTFFGFSGSGKSAMVRSIALNATEHCSVGYFPEHINFHRKLTPGDIQFSRQLTVYPGMYSEMSLSDIEAAFASHDLVIFDGLPIIKNATIMKHGAKGIRNALQQLAIKYGSCVIVCVTTMRNSFHDIGPVAALLNLTKQSEASSPHGSNGPFYHCQRDFDNYLCTYAVPSGPWFVKFHYQRLELQKNMTFLPGKPVYWETK